MLLESLVAYRVTVEHEYVSLVFTMDGLRHTMLRGIPIQREYEQDDFSLSKAQYLDLRFQITRCKYSRCLSSTFTNVQDRYY